MPNNSVSFLTTRKSAPTLLCRANSAPAGRIGFSSILKKSSTLNEMRDMYKRIQQRQARIQQITGLAALTRSKISRKSTTASSSVWKKETAFMWISADEESLCWRSGISSSTSACEPLHAVKCIYVGIPEELEMTMQSEASEQVRSYCFWRSIPELPWLACTLEFSSGQTICLQFQDELNLKRWYFGLNELLDKPQKVTEEDFYETIGDLKFSHNCWKLSQTANAVAMAAGSDPIDVLVHESIMLRHHAQNFDCIKVLCEY